ncbi:hypothetical protein COSHB9_07060 [Companilactobacillus alimentarius]|nr:hypothetical protein LAL01_21600 [Companilactobacillus alimentarius]
MPPNPDYLANSVLNYAEPFDARFQNFVLTLINPLVEIRLQYNNSLYYNLYMNECSYIHMSM